MTLKSVTVLDGHQVGYEHNGHPKRAVAGETIEVLTGVANSLAELGAVSLPPAPVTAGVPEAAPVKKG